MSALPPVARVIFLAIEAAAEIARALGDHETAQRVDEVLGERFPEFYRRAETAAEEVRRRLRG